MNPPNVNVSHCILLTVLVLLSANGLIASDINLPGMEIAALALHAPISSLQQTFSIYLIGLAAAQVVCGPLSDTYGRRSLVMGGLLLFIVGSILCALSSNTTVFAVGRLLQALGAGAGVVIGRAIVVDIFDKQAAARMFATIMPIVGASPALSPIIGGYLTLYISWRAPFLFTAALGVLTLILVFARIPETFSKEEKKRALLGTLKSYPRLLINPTFLAYTVNLGIAYAAYFGYLAASPVIFGQMGLGPDLISYCYISVAISYIVGNLISRNLVANYAINRLLLVGYAIFMAGALSFFLFSLNNPTSPMPVLLTMAIMTLGNGFLIPLSYAGGIASFPHNAGAASGLMGALQLATGSLAIYIVALVVNDAYQLSLFMVATAIIGSIVFPVLLYRSGIPSQTRIRSETISLNND
jgi:DHA1 family bicyclomycin/chloramphenicol resistance-like MFS transporter